MNANRHDVEMYEQAARTAVSTDGGKVLPTRTAWAAMSDAEREDALRTLAETSPATASAVRAQVEADNDRDAPPALTPDGAARIAAITGQTFDEVRADATAGGYDVVPPPTFDLTDESQLLYAFATDGLGYVYLLDNQGRAIARDVPDDESHAAHLATMHWLLDQTR
jgi:hypothetical protein